MYIGVEFLWNCLSYDKEYNVTKTDQNDIPKGAILADEMGLGKTLMTISIIFALHRKRRDHVRNILIKNTTLKLFHSSFSLYDFCFIQKILAFYCRMSIVLSWELVKRI